MAYPIPKFDFIYTLLRFAVFFSEVDAFFSPYYFQKQSFHAMAPRANGLLVANETAISLEACVNRPQDPTTSCVAQIEAAISMSSLNFCQRRYEEVNACYIFNNNNPSSCTTEQLDYQNCVAYTTLIYQYCIEYYDYYTEPYLSNCANTQLQVIPSDNAASTAGSGSYPTTISGVSIIPPFTLNSATATANPPNTAANTQSPEPTSTFGATCPSANSTIYVDPNGHAYLTQCSRNLPGYDLDTTTAADLASCIQACDAFVPGSNPTIPGSCVGVSFLGTDRVLNCVLKYRITDMPTEDPAVDSAQLVVLPTITITLGSTSTGLPPPVTTLPGSTITGQVTTTGAITYVTTIGTSLVQATTTGLIVSTQYGSVSAASSPSASECVVGKRVRALRQEEMHLKEWINKRLL